MRFKTLYKTFLVVAVASALLDYLITQIGFERFTPLFEANPYIRMLMRWFSPSFASTIIFLITLALIIGAYKLCTGYFKEEPYNGHLKDVWNYLTRSGTVKGRDLFIFATIALYIIFIHMHLTGFLSWLQLFYPQFKITLPMLPSIQLPPTELTIITLIAVAIIATVAIAILWYKKTAKTISH